MSYELSTNVKGTDDVMRIGDVLAKSGYFQDARDASQAIVKVLAGQELGIGPVAAMTGIYIVKGRVTMSANLMAAQVKRSGKYNYRTTEMSNENVSIVFYEQGQEIGTSSFSAEDAKQAGLWGSSDPWKKTPRNMLFARAMSNGCKWFCPDVFTGPVYTPDELGMEGDSASFDGPPVVVNANTGEIVTPPAAPKRSPTRAGMIARVKELQADADALKIPSADMATPKPIDQMTEAELIEFGKVLALAVKTAKEDSGKTAEA